ncbi:MAG: hypothetical protein AB8B79_05910 [Granulosicoccus sp.]
MTIAYFLAFKTAQAQGLPADADSFVESLDPSVQVSGQMLGGLMFRGDESQKVSIESLFADFSLRNGKPSDVVCFRIASGDGVYTAKWTVTLKDSIVGRESFEFKSGHASYLNSLEDDDLVVIASVDGQCGSSNVTYLPTGWASESENATRLTAFLNTDASVVFAALLVPSTDTTEVMQVKAKCDLLQDSQANTNFDTICDLEWDSTLIAEVSSLSIVAQYGSSYRPPAIFRLRPKN